MLRSFPNDAAQQFYRHPAAISRTEVRSASTARFPYSQTVFAALRKQLGGTLIHHGFPGSHASTESVDAHRFPDDVPEGCTRMILGKCEETGHYPLRVTWKRLGKTRDAHLKIPFPTLPCTEIAKADPQEFHARQVLLWSAAMTADALSQGGAVLDAGMDTVNALVKQIAAVSEEDILNLPAGVAVASLPDPEPAFDAAILRNRADFSVRQLLLQAPPSQPAGSVPPAAMPSSIAPSVVPSAATLFADDKKLAKLLKEGVGAYAKGRARSSKYKVSIGGLNHMHDPAPEAGADKCMHAEFSQQELGKPILIEFTMIDKDCENGGKSLTVSIPFPGSPGAWTVLNGKLLPLAAHVMKLLRTRTSVSAADVENLLKSETIALARRAIFGKERVKGINNRELVTALLAFKPILKSTGAVQVNESKDPGRLFEAFRKILNDDINREDAERQRRHGEQPFELCMTGLDGMNALQVSEGKRALCLVFGKHPETEDVTLHIVGSPGVPAEQEHIYVPVSGMKEETVQQWIFFWAARLAIKGLKGDTTPEAGNPYNRVRCYREALMRKPGWRTLAGDEAQFLAGFRPLMQAPDHLERIRALAAEPCFQHGAVSVSQTIPGGARALSLKRPGSNRGKNRLQPRPIASVDLPPATPLSHLALFDILLELTEEHVNDYVMVALRYPKPEAPRFKLTVDCPGKKQRISNDLETNRLHLEWGIDERGAARYRIVILRTGEEVGQSYEYAVPRPGPRADPNIPHFPFMAACVARHLIVPGDEAPTGRSLTSTEAYFRGLVVNSGKWTKQGHDYEKVLAEFQPGAGRAPAGPGLQADDSDAATPPKMPRVLEMAGLAGSVKAGRNHLPTGRSQRVPTAAAIASQPQ